jgi:hypothetical protein
MAKSKRKEPKGRWGRKLKDNRDWTKYSEELVVRGEFLLESNWVGSWDNELAAMNKGKRGKPFAFPESLISLQGVWHQWIDYRGVEGITRKMAEHGIVPIHNDFSTINRRVNKLDIAFALPRSGNVSVACDGTGMKFENGGEHRARLYGKKKRRHIRVIITANPFTKELLDCDVSVDGEGLSEPDFAEESMRHMQAEGLQVTKFWGDGGFDDKDLFGFLEANCIEPAIPTQKNAVLSGNDTLRDKEVMARKKLGYKKWAKKRKYGQRWTGTEGIFSAVKRKFGENTRAHDAENVCHEAKMKLWAYEAMKAYATT